MPNDSFKEENKILLFHESKWITQLSLEYEHLNVVIKEIFSKIITIKFLIEMTISIIDRRLNIVND